MDYFIQVTFVLLVLSMITEKFANWIKLRLPDNPVKRMLVKNIAHKYANTLDEYEEMQKDKKVREIQTLTFLIGCVVAFATRANLFKLYDPEFKLSWFEVEYSSYTALDGVSDFIGCFLTGVFLSFGSKFFHDLLGVLMETKNLKRKLRNRESVEDLNTINEVDSYLKEIEPVVIEKKIEEYFKDFPYVNGFEYSDVDKTVDVFVSEMSADEQNKLDKFIRLELSNRKRTDIEVNYIGI
ncbi:MAG: hypothetical protein HUJ25_10555 [Crocinitomicaceae bacterium]|nr:hypothetical protein [Crocinitomicaceae bacterium]